ncbi:MAG TPA: pantoate--beta-alanine ligase, partial [Rhizomicrobium sp.]
IVRDASGLALSSRNIRLLSYERDIAERLNIVLTDLVDSLRDGDSIAEVEAFGRDALRMAGFDSVDYVAVRDAATLAKIERLGAQMRVLAAATVGNVRLIDNMPV